MLPFRVATHSWNGDGTSGEAGGYLLFVEGAHIEVLQEGESDGWWYGRLGDRAGWFPESFTTIERADFGGEGGGADGDGGAGDATANSVCGTATPPPLPRAFSMQVIDQALRRSFRESVNDNLVVV